MLFPVSEKCNSRLVDPLENWVAFAAVSLLRHCSSHVYDLFSVNRDFLPPCYRKHFENSTASSMKDFHEAFSTESWNQLHRTDKFRHVVLKCKECVKSHPEFKQDKIVFGRIISLDHIRSRHLQMMGDLGVLRNTEVDSLSYNSCKKLLSEHKGLSHLKLLSIAHCI